MSIEYKVESNCSEQAGTCSTIEISIKPKEHDLGGFSVRRSIPAISKKMIGPWIFFDHMGPATFTPGDGINVRPHPHIGLATVTYLFDGEMLHKDSLGNDLTIYPGEINLMVAGNGIVHSERQREEIKASNNNSLHGLQLWLALPETEEEMDAEFHHYSSEAIPSITVNDVNLRVLIGSAYNVTSPVKTFAQTFYIEASLKAGQSLTLPDNYAERGLYVVSGALTTQDNQLEQHSMTVFHADKSITVSAEKNSQIAIIGGEKLSRRYIDWNFVSSHKDRIEQAKQDWQSGNFPTVPGDEIEFIPLPAK